jgi:glutathione synthase/RimK-type ligase-like ATP-grasp enzyme
LRIPVLLACALPNWIGTARLPSALARAGFAVTLLAPRDALATRSRYVDRLVLLREGWKRREWIEALRAAIDAGAPQIVIPGDEVALHLLIALVLYPPTTPDSETFAQLAALVRHSLGEPAHYVASTDKVELPIAAAAAGVPVPSYARLDTPDDARAFARENGLPLVLKAPQGFSGDGVAICRDDDALAIALSHWELLIVQHPQLRGRSFLGQAYVDGPTLSRTSIAWRGSELAGTTREKLVRHPAATGPATVVRYFHDARIAEYSARLIEAFAITGFAGIEYIADSGGRILLLEINRRVTPGASGGAIVGVDLCQALHAAMRGAPSPARRDLAPGEERIVARFPQEWLRDPTSDWLRQYPVDAPWDDPDLMSAMLAMRGGAERRA